MHRIHIRVHFVCVGAVVEELDNPAITDSIWLEQFDEVKNASA